jgi:hypothetical protein
MSAVWEVLATNFAVTLVVPVDWIAKLAVVWVVVVLLM